MKLLRKVVFTFQLILFLLSSIISLSQGINQIDAQGRKQGVWKKSYENGQIRYEGNFKNDQPVGEFRYYHPNGKLKAIIRHTNDGYSSAAELYNENGILVAKGFFYDEHKDKTWEYFNEKNGKLISIENYQQGIPHGDWIVYFKEDTVVTEIFTFVHGQKEGPWKQFFPDGKLKLDANYLHHQLDGPYTLYSPEGKELVHGNYQNGKKIGEWKFFTDDGKLKRIEWYDEDEKIKEEILIPEEPIKDVPLDPALDPENQQQYP